MGMRLLSKREVDLKKSQDRKREIDEGVKLAKRVDDLRQLAAEEEKNLEDFRVKTVKAFREEMTEKEEQRDFLDTEIDIKTRARNTIALPLDKVLEQLRESNKTLQEQKIELELKESEFQKYRSMIEEDMHLIENEKGRIAEEKHRTTQFLVQAKNDLDYAQEVLAKANEKERLISASLSFKEKELIEREEKATQLIAEAEVQTKKIEKYEVELMKRELTLRDGWKTLEASSKELYDSR